MSDLWAVAAYFNPAGYRTKRANFDRFRADLDRTGVPLVTVEAAFADRPFDLPPGPGVVQLRGTAVLWQKERLLTLALAHLPVDCAKVAWLDADVLFDNPAWATDTAKLLDRVPVVQPFDKVIRLPRDGDPLQGIAYPSFAAVSARSPQLLLSGDFAAHGHTGFAWAARREVLAAGFYDAAIAGSGDHLMAHAFAGDWQSACIDRVVGTGRHRRHFTRWAESCYTRVRGRVGCVPGTLRHLWHGEVADRRYVDRNRELAELGFDPERHLRVGANGLWEWAGRSRKLAEWADRYFTLRNEDGT